MPSVDQLSVLTTLGLNDLFPFYSNTNGDTYSISASNLATFIQSLMTVSDGKITQYASPSLTGFSTQINDDNKSVFLVLTPTGGFAAGTLVFPSKAKLVDKQEVMVSCTQAITTLTITATGTNLIGAPTTLTANSYFRMRYDIINSTWYRVG